MVLVSIPDDVDIFGLPAISSVAGKVREQLYRCIGDSGFESPRNPIIIPKHPRGIWSL